MTDVSSIAGAAAAAAPSTASSALASSSSLGMNDFLKLMTTQLQAQDPLNPMDNTQMAAQLAQFSSVAGISEMNANIKSLAGELTGSRVGNAASWIGRDALVSSGSAAPLSDGSYAGQVTLPSAITSGTLNLVDAGGRVVHTEQLGTQGAGTVPFSWDGKDAGGNAVAGPLRLSVTARDGTGANIAATTSAWTGITGVQSPATGTTKLVTAIGTIDPTAALQLG